MSNLSAGPLVEIETVRRGHQTTTWTCTSHLTWQTLGWGSFALMVGRAEVVDPYCVRLSGLRPRSAKEEVELQSWGHCSWVGRRDPGPVAVMAAVAVLPAETVAGIDAAVSVADDVPVVLGSKTASVGRSVPPAALRETAALRRCLTARIRHHE